MAGAICYIRVSTAEQASGNNSLPVQEKKLRDYCKLHDLPVLKVLVTTEVTTQPKSAHS